MKAKINSFEDLQMEIVRLMQVKEEQEKFLENQFVLLKRKVQTPVRIFNSISSAIPGANLSTGLLKNLSAKNPDGTSVDLITRIARLGVPLLLNSTVLKNTSWLKKGLVLLASETAAGQLNKEKVTNAINKLVKMIRPKKKKNNKVEVTEMDVFEDAPEEQILGI